MALAIATDPPSDTSVLTLSDVTLTITSGTPTVTVTWTDDAADQYILLAFSPPMSAGRRFPPRFWQEEVLPSEDGDGTVSPTANFTAEFGTLIQGQRVFAKLTPVNGLGWTGTPSIVSAVIS